MSISWKDFEAVAVAIKETRQYYKDHCDSDVPQYVLDRLSDTMCWHLKQLNPRFNMERFKSANRLGDVE